ncbi:fluoride efflux transporter CrcB [Micromonospora sp. WMMD1082]|uniref:fluoride efflux transporter CrcB n=1 Tax=Micromonospora sp. WMMD1082 TaxID=3016104 RepID=UPI0024159963|nr:fluoride efflux transporter CrcB [Micromonospora sp. WMMD1082]MDG4795842.1 fluoride efflux transporter CrcB [Micromonospora sp. WMMD1082]
MSVLLVALGAAVGAPLRYLVDRAVQARYGSAFPWGTLIVNVVGSLVLGVLIGGAAVGAVPGSLVTLLGTGLCGALTTYSTFGYETVRLFEDGTRGYALLNAGLSVAAGLGAAFAGVALAEALWS